MNLKKEITEFMEEKMTLTEKMYNLDEKIEKELYSDDKYRPEVFFDSYSSCSDTKCHMDIEVEYDNISIPNDEIIQKIIDSINETFSVFKNYESVQIYDFEYDYSSKSGKVTFSLDYEK